VLGFHLIVIRRHVISLVSCDSSCDFADVLMTLSSGSADLIMSFGWLESLWVSSDCLRLEDISASLFSVQQ